MESQDILGRRIREVRRHRGISQQWLAQQAGLSKQALYAIETGKVDPRASRVAKIAKALRVTSDYLLGLKDTEELGDMVRPLAVA